MAFLASAESGLMTGSIVDFDQTIHGCWDTRRSRRGRWNSPVHPRVEPAFISINDPGAAAATAAAISLSLPRSFGQLA